MNKEKIQKLIDKMLKNQNAISSVIKESINDSVDEYYFAYPNNEYSWSITENTNDEVYMFYYPNKNKLSDFLRFRESEIEPSNIRLLLEAVRNKLYGFDNVLDKILTE